MAVTVASNVLQAARYLGVSAVDLQKCVNATFTAKQTAQRLGLSSVGVQRAFTKYANFVLDAVPQGGKACSATVGGVTPNGPFTIDWGDTLHTADVADGTGAGGGYHVYALTGPYTITLTDDTSHRTTTQDVTIT